MAIPWWIVYGPLGHPVVEEHLEKLEAQFQRRYRIGWVLSFISGMGFGAALLRWWGCG